MGYIMIRVKALHENYRLIRGASRNFGEKKGEGGMESYCKVCLRSMCAGVNIKIDVNLAKKKSAPD